MAKSQKESMETRLQSAGEAGSSSIGTVAAIAFDTASSAHGEGAPRHVATVLHEIYTLFTHAVLGYSMLHAAAHRVYDLTTAEDLATQHMKGYAAAAQEIHQLIADVVCWELSNDGQECRCVCDVCGLGLCICASHRRGSGERETTASSLAGKEESSRKEDNSGQGKDGPAGAIAQGGNGR